MTAFIHELGHNLENTKNTFALGIRTQINSFRTVWEAKGFTGITFAGVLQESFADLVAVKWVEDYISDVRNAFTNDRKYDIIKKSFGWILEFPKSRIEAGHPHHPFRVNLLLTSIPIHNFLCAYTGDPNLRKFTVGQNPACATDAVYNATNDPYYSKYIKYKNKYLSLKN